MELSKLSIKHIEDKLISIDIGDCWIAGGYIRDLLFNRKFSDIDVFGPDQECLQAFIDTNFEGLTPIHKSKTVVTYNYKETKIQVVQKTFESVEKCLDAFDYTICQFAWAGEDILTTPEAVLHAAQQHLYPHKIHKEFALDSLRRFQKYIKKGYTACGGSLAEVAKALSGVTEAEITDQFAKFYDQRFD